ncbi:MAG: hypothetical protein GC155_02710 [Alphaproteobacteria bacterium]|nr:hypothetical protein [Alphaproteobacteria bacterium]
MALAIPLVAIIGGLSTERMKMKLKLKEAGSATDREERMMAILEANEREMAKLKDRVAVLERLVTDDDRRLAGEIERLGGGRRDAAV